VEVRLVAVGLPVSLTIGRIIEFLIGWVVSGVIIYVVLKLYPGKQKMESLWGAMLAALIGEAIYTFFNIIGIPYGTILALFVWLYAIKKMFNVGWGGAIIIAVLVYIFSGIVSLLGIPHLL